MAGLPRSGSTVLTALLNQHPDVYASSQSDLVNMLFGLNEQIPNYESHKAGMFHEGYKNVMNSIASNFYAHIDKPVIIDKNRGWGAPYNWDNLSHYVDPKRKVILTMRPILEVLASFIKVIEKSEKITGDAPYYNEEFWVTHYRDKRDAQVDYIMKLNGELDRSIFSIANLLKNHSKNTHIVWFNDLIENPQDTLNGIYDFLEIEKHQNNFDSIQEINKQNDLNAYKIFGLHDIGKKLKNPGTNPEDYLSDYVIGRYGNALDFLWGR
jgi:sulfotransferase